MSEAQHVPATEGTAFKSDGKLNWPTVALIGLGDLLLWGLGIGSTFWFFGHDIGVAGIAFSTVAPALWTFILFYRDAADVRTAFTASLLTLYLGFVAASFNGTVDSDFQADGSFIHSVWENLNTLMIAVVGFYFGGKALERATTTVAEAKKGQTGSE